MASTARTSRLGPRNKNFFGEQKDKENARAAAGGGGSSSSGRAIEERFRAARGSGVLNLSETGIQVLSREIMSKFGADCGAGEAWWGAAACSEIRLAGNSLRKIDVDAFEEIHDTLSVVQLDDNELEVLPEALAVLETLRKLSLTRNRLRSLGNVAPWRDLVALACSHNELEALPRAFADLDALRVLDLRYNRLRTIEALPPGLEQLLVSHNELTVLDARVLGAAPGLQELVVSNNRLVRLDVEPLTHVKVIDARQNELEVFGPLPCSDVLDQLLLGFNRLRSTADFALANAPHLTVLDLAENKVEDLDEKALCACAALKMLDLNNNNLASLPPGLGYMASLQGLNVIGNPLRGIRFSVLQSGAEKLKAYLRTKGEMPAQETTSSIAKGATGGAARVGAHGSTANMDPLQTLLWEDDRLRDAHARATSSGILNLEGLLLQADSPAGRLELLLTAHLPDPATPGPPLVDLNLARNALPVVPATPSLQPAAWASLRRLCLEENRIRNVDASSLIACPLLEELVLCRNEICEFDLRDSLPHLRILDLRQNKLREIPGCVLEPPLGSILEEVLLGFNQITRVQTSVSRLQRLRRLDLSNCALEQVPPGIDTLNALEYLNFENGALHTIPVELARLPRLQTLLISGNPQRAIRPHIIAEGSTKLLEYLRGRCPASAHAESEAKEPCTLVSTETSQATPAARESNAVDEAALEAKVKELEDRLENDLSLSSAARSGLKRQLARERATLLRARRAK